MVKSGIRNLITIVVAIVTVFCPFLIVGQNDTLVTKLNEITVVGTKQTPTSDMSVYTQIDSIEIQRLNIVTIKDASRMVPNLYMPSYGSRMTSSIYVRGLGARIDQPVVGLSVDNVPYLNKDNYDFDLFDIKSIEIYRGAQSVLNGRNTMAGQINISTLSPWQYKGVRFMTQFGKANSLKAGVGYYTQISENIATSLSLYYTRTDGYFKNKFNNQNIDKEQQGNVRWKLSWHPSRRLSITNTAYGQITRQGGYPYVLLKDNTLSYNDTCFYRRNSFSDGLTIGWTGNRVLVTSVTSLQYIDDNMTLDQDFTPREFFIMSQKRRETAITQDLYAKGSRGNFNWLGGIFAFNKHGNMHAPVTFKNDGVTNLVEARPNEINPQYPIEWDTRSFLLGSDFKNTTRGVAFYQQSYYEISGLRAEFGLRLDVEQNLLDFYSHCNTGYKTYHILPDGNKEFYAHTPVIIDERGSLSHTYVQLLPKFAVGYTFGNGFNFFADVVKGYKSGGYNTQMFSDVLQQRIMELMGLTMVYDVDEVISYKPEKSWNYEIGVKMPIKPGILSVDATIFYLTCIDQQLTKFPPGLTTGRIMTNAGKTRSFGTELSVDFIPNNQISLNASYGYTNARFVKYNNGRTDLKGKRLPYAPQNTLFISATYTLPVSISGCTPSVNVNTRGVGSIYWDDENTITQPFYATLGASFTLKHAHGQLQLWGENLTNTKYNTFYFVSMGNAFVQRSNPICYGATLRLNF